MYTHKLWISGHSLVATIPDALVTRLKLSDSDRVQISTTRAGYITLKPLRSLPYRNRNLKH